MKKLYIVNCLLFSFFLVNAKQVGDSISSKWSIGILGSIDNYIYHFNNNEYDGFESSHYYEGRSLHYSEGLLLTRKLINKFDLVSGITYSEKGFNRVTNPMLLPPYYYGEWRFKEVRHYAYYGEIPVLIQFTSNKNNGFTGIISSGFITSIPLKESDKYITVDGQEISTTNTWEWNKNYKYDSWLTLNKTWQLHASALLGSGIGYNLRKFFFSLQTFYQYYYINIYNQRLAKKAQSFSSMFMVAYHF